MRSRLFPQLPRIWSGDKRRFLLLTALFAAACAPAGPRGFPGFRLGPGVRARGQRLGLGAAGACPTGLRYASRQAVINPGQRRGTGDVLSLRWPVRQPSLAQASVQAQAWEEAGPGLLALRGEEALKDFPYSQP